MDMSMENLERGMRYISPTKDWEWFSPWDIFIQGTNIHLGKRSMGWKFCWNFHVRPKVLHNFIGLHGIERKIFPKNNSVHAIHFFFFSCALGKETVDIKMFT